jgi:uncharacterized protein DUF1552
MFVTRKHISRRAVLRGVGAGLALPLLEAMVPAATALAATAAVPRRRFGAVYIPNGAVMAQWIPKTAGADFEFTPIMKPLEPFRPSLTVVSNLCRAGGDVAGDHAASSAGWLSGAVAKRTEAEDVRVGRTVDQIIAQRIGQDTPFPSMELATEDFTGYVGGCVPGYSCAYMNTISWTSATTPQPMEINPRVVFERMFGRAGTPAQRVARMRNDRSILDSITAETTRLRRELGESDQARLGEYLDNVREIERRIQRTEARNGADVTSIDAPVGVPESYEEHVGLMFDLLSVACQADLTRVFTFMMARELSNRTYTNLDLSEPHHSISHHGNDPAKVAAHTKINIYHVGLFAKFLEKLQSTPDGDGSLLDHSTIFYGGGMGEGNGHSPYPMSVIAVSGGTGPERFKGNRHVIAADRTPIADYWLTVANRFGCEIDSLGESKGHVEL